LAVEQDVGTGAQLFPKQVC